MLLIADSGLGGYSYAAAARQSVDCRKLDHFQQVQGKTDQQRDPDERQHQAEDKHGAWPSCHEGRQ